MRTMKEWYTGFLLTLMLVMPGCAQNLPVAASCPPPDPLPKAVMERQSVSTPTSLTKDFEQAWTDFLNETKLSLEKAKVQPGPSNPVQTGR